MTGGDPRVERAVALPVGAVRRALDGALDEVGKAPRMSSGETWASPKLRTPGVSMIQPSPPGSSSAIADDEVCRPRAGHRVDLAVGPLGVRHQRVHQGRLADAGVADEHAHPPGQPLGELVDRLVPAR